MTPPPDTSTPFSRLLAERRTALGLSQVQLAKLVGMGRTYYRDIEFGRAGIADPERLRKLADALRIDLDTLYVARNMIPEDVSRMLFARPQLLNAVRTMSARLDARDKEPTQ